MHAYMHTCRWPESAIIVAVMIHNGSMYMSRPYEANG